MAGLSTITLLFLITIAALATALIVSVIVQWSDWRRTRLGLTGRDDQIVFLFQDRVLVDATPAARHLLARHRARGTEWEQLIDQLGRSYPGLRAAAAHRMQDGQFLSNVPGDDSILSVSTSRDMLRITLHEASQPQAMVHPLAVGAMEDELRTLRTMSHDTPQLMWKEDQAGTITWANRAYLRLADQAAPARQETGPAWPPHRIFAGLEAPRTGQEMSRRVSVTLPGGGDPVWFDVRSLRQGTETAHFATDAGDAVLAEKQGRKFVQTLTKTFAQLSIGLAIFDRERRLVMFNPALLDLTRLPVEFLSGRPIIFGFLDRLRDRNMLPEPKNYNSWREQVAALETAAAAGTYCENWTLPGGQTYKVTGRPHPDGALAFIFEDITAELALTRAFRTELETAQNVLEAMDEAIAVFSPSGTLTMSNAAYSDVWGHSDASLEDHTLRGEIGLWQDRTAPSPLWAALRQTARTTGRPKASRTAIRMTDGRAAICRCVPIGGGSTLVAFHIPAATTAIPLPERGPERAPEHEIEDAALPELTFRRA